MHPNRTLARLYNVIRLLAVLPLAASLALAQAPKVGDINFYGLHKVTPDELLAMIALHPGDPIPRSKGDLEQRIAEYPAVTDARVEAVCCQGPNAALFIGVEEAGAPRFETRSEPSGNGVLPEEILERYHDYMAAIARVPGAEVPRQETAFVAFAADQLTLLRDVLRESSEPEQRAAAAILIAYAPKPAAILGDLQYALKDPDDTVRANAIRSLRRIAPGLKVDAAVLVEMLESIALSDRVQAAQALVALTEQRDRATLDAVRERGLPALAEMARWKTSDYAMPAFVLLGRSAGIVEPQIQDAWRKGDREPVIRKATGER
jgi:HEAT repeats